MPQQVTLKKLKLNSSMKTDDLELTAKRDAFIIIGDWNAKVGSRDSWSNGQIWPWSTE